MKNLPLYVEILLKVFLIPLSLGLIIPLCRQNIPFLEGWEPRLKVPPLPFDYISPHLGEEYALNVAPLLIFQISLSLVLSLFFRVVLVERTEEWGVWLSRRPSRILIFLLFLLQKALTSPPFVFIVEKKKVDYWIEGTKKKVLEYSPAWQRFNYGRLRGSCFLLFYAFLFLLFAFLYIEWVEIWYLLDKPFKYMVDLNNYPLLYYTLKGIRSIFGAKVYLSLLLLFLNTPFVERWCKSLQEDKRTSLTYRVSRFLLLLPEKENLHTKRRDLFLVFIVLSLLEIFLLPFAHYLQFNSKKGFF